MKKEGFSPLINENTEILVLGTMPSDKSISSGEYYANPTNQFWKLIFAIFNSAKPVCSYNEKVEILLRNKIGLWDVLSKAIRSGSLDSKIKDEEFNDFSELFRKYPKLKLVLFNGQKSAEYFTSNFKIPLEIKYFILPSTSSANTTKTFENKLKEWKTALMH